MVLVVVLVASKATNRDARLGLTTDKVLDRLDDDLLADRTVTGTLRVAAPGAPPSRPPVATSSSTSATGPAARPRRRPLGRGLRRLDEHLSDPRHPSPGRHATTKVSLTSLAPGPPDPSGFDARATGDPLAATLRLLHEGTGRQVTTSALLPAGTTDTSQATAVWVITAHLPRSSAAALHPLLAGVGSLATEPAATRSASVVDQSLLLPLRLQVLHAGCVGDRRPPRVARRQRPAPGWQPPRRRRRAHRHARPRVPRHGAQRCAGRRGLPAAHARLRPRRVRADQRRGPGHGTRGRPQHRGRHQPARRRRGVPHLPPRLALAHRHHPPHGRLGQGVARPLASSGSRGRHRLTGAHRPRRDPPRSGAFAGTTARADRRRSPTSGRSTTSTCSTVAGDLGASQLHTVAASMH